MFPDSCRHDRTTNHRLASTAAAASEAPRPAGRRRRPRRPPPAPGCRAWQPGDRLANSVLGNMLRTERRSPPGTLAADGLLRAAPPADGGQPGLRHPLSCARLRRCGRSALRLPFAMTPLEVLDWDAGPRPRLDHREPTAQSARRRRSHRLPRNGPSEIARWTRGLRQAPGGACPAMPRLLNSAEARGAGRRRSSRCRRPPAWMPRGPSTSRATPSGGVRASVRRPRRRADRGADAGWTAATPAGAPRRPLRRRSWLTMGRF